MIEATHPDLATDFADYKPEYYSLIIVRPDDATLAPVYHGYLQSKQESPGFEVISLDAVADVEGDGRWELLVRTRHHEGWQSQVFHYEHALKQIFYSIGGESDCSVRQDE